MKEIFDIVWKILVLSALLAIVTAIKSHGAESAIVSFNNAEHLTALQDSVVGV